MPPSIPNLIQSGLTSPTRNQEGRTGAALVARDGYDNLLNDEDRAIAAEKLL